MFSTLKFCVWDFAKKREWSQGNLWEGQKFPAWETKHIQGHWSSQESLGQSQKEMCSRAEGIAVKTEKGWLLRSLKKNMYSLMAKGLVQLWKKWAQKQWEDNQGCCRAGKTATECKSQDLAQRPRGKRRGWYVHPMRTGTYKDHTKYRHGKYK